MEAIIQIKELSKTFPGRDNVVEALKGINLDIGKGNICGVIGMSGAGKSTLVRCLNFLEKPTSGTVLVEGKDLRDMNNAQLRKARTEIAMIFQHFNLLMQRNVIDNICFPLEIVGMKKKEARKRAAELLEVVGLSEKAKAYPAQLSGGQKQRVAIARALASRPAIILADEPTGNLDSKTEMEVISILKTCVHKYGQTLVMITHDETIAQMADRVMIIEDGKVVR